MGATYNPQIKRFNGTDWDLINPKTLASLVKYDGTNNSVKTVLDSKANSSDIGNGVLTIKLQEETIGSFSANAGSNTTIDINAIPYTEKDVAYGVAGLDANRKIPLARIPDVILGQVMYGGNVNISSGIATISTQLQAKLGITDATIKIINSSGDNTSASPKQYGYATLSGVYFIVGTGGTFASIAYEVGDWCISRGNAWDKIDNTDAVTSVNGNIGAVVLHGGNIYQNGSSGTTINAAIAAKQDKVAARGDDTTPVYVSANGVFATCLKYAGGTAVTLNGVDKSESDASFYAPTSLGSANQILGMVDGTIGWRDLPPGTTDTWRDVYVNSSQVQGQGTNTGALKFINGTNTTAVWDSTNKTIQFNAVGSNIPLQASAPANPTTGMIWFDTAA